MTAGALARFFLCGLGWFAPFAAFSSGEHGPPVNENENEQSAQCLKQQQHHVWNLDWITHWHCRNRSAWSRIGRPRSTRSDSIGACNSANEPIRGAGGRSSSRVDFAQRGALDSGQLERFTWIYGGFDLECLECLDIQLRAPAAGLRSPLWRCPSAQPGFGR